MKKYLLLGLLALALLLVVRYIAKGSRQYQIATTVSKLDLPRERNLELIDFKEKWDEADGNGYLYVIYQLSVEDMKELITESKKKGYTPLPSNSRWAKGINTHWQRINNGLHLIAKEKVGTNKNNLKLSLIDIDKNYLIVYIQVS